VISDGKEEQDVLDGTKPKKELNGRVYICESSSSKTTRG
jgi:hypothetical protein